MTNFSRIIDPIEIVATICILLDEDTVNSKVGELLEYAHQQFQLEVTVPITHAEFNRVIATFIQHLYEKGIRLPRTLSYQEALAEAVFILDRYYDNDEAREYDGALLDAVGKNKEGIEMVLAQMTEALKTQEQMKYINWVFTCHIDCLDWETRKELIIFCLKLNEKFLPRNLLHANPDRFSKVIRELISDYCSDVKIFRQIIDGRDRC